MVVKIVRKNSNASTISIDSGSTMGEESLDQRLANINQQQQPANLYKTELCRSFTETGYCRYGAKCQFAHGAADLRPVLRHRKYKTEKCKNFERDGVCPYGSRCRFIHNEQEVRWLTPASMVTPSSKIASDSIGVSTPSTLAASCETSLNVPTASSSVGSIDSEGEESRNEGEESMEVDGVTELVNDEPGRLDLLRKLQESAVGFLLSNSSSSSGKGVDYPFFSHPGGYAVFHDRVDMADTCDAAGREEEVSRRRLPIFEKLSVEETRSH